MGIGQNVKHRKDMMPKTVDMLGAPFAPHYTQYAYDPMYNQAPPVMFNNNGARMQPAQMSSVFPGIATGGTSIGPKSRSSGGKRLSWELNAWSQVTSWPV